MEIAQTPIVHEFKFTVKWRYELLDEWGYKSDYFSLTCPIWNREMGYIKQLDPLDLKLYCDEFSSESPPKYLAVCQLGQEHKLFEDVQLARYWVDWRCAQAIKQACMNQIINSQL